MANPLPLYLPVDGVYEAQHLAQPWGDVISEGVLLAGAPAGLDPLKVSPLTPAAMAVEVAAGAAWVKNDGADEASAYFEAGAWRLSRPESIQVPIEASEAQPRIDRVLLEVLDTAFGAASDVGRARVVKGTAAASPSAPAEPSHAITLALVTVPASAGTIVAGNISDQRPRASMGGRVPGGISKVGEAILTSAAADIDFTSIPQTGSNLLLLTSLRVDASTGGTFCRVRLNGDGSAIYDRQELTGAGTAANAAEVVNEAGFTAFNVPGATAGPALFGGGFLLLPAYIETGHHQEMLGLSGRHVTGGSLGGFQAHLRSGMYRNQAAVTRATIIPNSGNFVAGSRASLYAL